MSATTSATKTAKTNSTPSPLPSLSPLPTVAHCTRQALLNAPDPAKVTLPALTMQVKELFRAAGGRPQEVKYTTVVQAYKHAIRHCGRPLTHERLRRLVNGLAKNPHNYVAGSIGSQYQSKRTQSSKPNTSHPPRQASVANTVSLPPMDTVQATVYTTEQILQAKAFIKSFGGDTEHAAQFLRLIGKE